jgi:hypothetical protein
MRTRLVEWVLVAVAFSSMANASTITLGSFNFNSNQFGNTLNESDGGTYRMSNWLNIVNADPGNPGAITGPNFNTGIANIGDFSSVAIDYTIGYNTPIVNGAGVDMGLVTGYSYFGDTYHVAVSTDGINFTSFVDFKGSSGTDTLVNMSYYYGGGGPFSTDLIVVPIDLSAFGIAPGGSVVAVELEGRPGEQPDLFRIAGFQSSSSTTPEPGSLVLFGSGLVGLSSILRRKLMRRST